MYRIYQKDERRADARRALKRFHWSVCERFRTRLTLLRVTRYSWRLGTGGPSWIPGSKSLHPQQQALRTLSQAATSSGRSEAVWLHHIPWRNSRASDVSHSVQQGRVPPVTFSPALHVLPTYAASAVLPSEALNRIHALPVTRHPLPPALLCTPWLEPLVRSALGGGRDAGQ